jgi:LuxR family maltose regulon positive regulatory protein
MKSNLVATKLHQPAPSSRRIGRPHLAARLNQGLAGGRKLTLVSAPAGFGKTSLVSEWTAGLRRPVAWLSLDESDDEAVRFFAYFVAALQRVDENIGQEVQRVLRSGQLPPEEVISTVLINDILETPDRFLLVLDDFQVIQERTILQVLESMLNNQPQLMHLVLVTREDPPLPLARLRANDQMTEIRAGDLRFSSAETQRFLNEIMGLSLAQNEIEALQRRTEGWAVGLQLAGLSMQGKPAPADFIARLGGRQRYILSYLTEEVLSTQPEDVQNFLLRTSILNKLNGGLCDVVTRRTDSSELLERLYHANLFLIPLDEQGRWYRYHHLFGDLLLNQLHQSQEESLPDLHQRASRWYEAAEMPGEAIDHALAAKDYARTVALLESQAMDLINQGYAKTVERWMQQIPAHMHSQSPRANLALAWMHLLRGSYSRISPYLEKAQTALPQDEAALDRMDENSQALQAEISSLQSNLLHVQGKVAASIEQANRALDLADPLNFYIRGLAYLGLGGAYRQAGDYTSSARAYQNAIQASRAAGNPVPEMLAVSGLTLMAIQHGQLRFAAEVCSQALERLEHGGDAPPPIAGAAHGALGLVNYEWGQIDSARQHFERALQLGTLGGHNASVIYTRTAQARMFQAMGELQAAGEALQEAVSLLEIGAPAWLRPEVAAQQVRLYLFQNDPLAAETVLEAHGISSQEFGLPEIVGYPRELLYIARIRLRLYRALERNRPEELEPELELANLLYAQAVADQRMGIALQILLVRARVRLVLGDRQASLKDLEQALALGAPQGYQQIFVEEGPAMAALLRMGRADSAHKDTISRLLQAFPAEESAPASAQTKTNQQRIEPLIEPLTEREKEVLALMAEGLTYREIAERLVVSVNTVRYHVKGVYGKLNVNNRTKAVESARRLELL